MSKWEPKLPIIEGMIGIYSTEDIAKEIGTTTNNLHKICHRNNISLPRDIETYNGGRKPKRELTTKDAINLLTEKGYQVIKPDLFKRTTT